MELLFSSLKMIPFIIGVLCLPVLYTRMCYLLHVHSKQLRNFNGEARNNCNTVVDMRHLTARQERNRRAIRTSVIVVVVFLLSVVPRTITWISPHFYWHAKIYEATVCAYPIYFLGVVTANPFLYAFSDTTILAGYKKTPRKLVGL